MIKTIFRKHRLFYIILTSIFALYLITTFSIEFIYNSNSKAHEKQAQTILASINKDKDLSYVSAKQLEYLLDLSGLSHDTRGEINRLLSEISYLNNNKTDYNTSIAKAFYHLGKAGEKVKVAELMLEYVGHLYTTGGYNQSKRILTDINKYIPTDEAKEPMLALHYHLCSADNEEMLGEYTLAETHLNKAKKIITSKKDYTDNIHYPIYIAKYYILSARMCIENNDFETAQVYMSQYNVSDQLGLPDGNQFVICDFTIPYLEIMTRLALQDGNSKQAVKYIDNYLTICNDNNLPMMEYKMLCYIMSEKSAFTNKQFQEYETKAINLSINNLNLLANRYCDTMLINVEQTMDASNSADTIQSHFSLNIHIIECFLLLCMLIIGGIRTYSFACYTDKDTCLRTRLSFEKTRTKLERKKIPYALLLLDIDDFQILNQSVGHEMGNRILQQVALKLLSNISPNSTAYRYGGEEFCIILRPEDNSTSIMDYAKETSEKIRQEIASSSWNELMSLEPIHLTISGGLAQTATGENPFQQASHNLFQAKTHGKNQIYSS